MKETKFKQTEVGMIPSDWEVKPIKELGLFLGGGTPSTKNESFWKGNIPWISSADLNDDDIEHISMTRFITQEAVNFSATQICPQGTILIIARVGVGKLALSQQKVCTSQDFCNLIPSKENDSKFLAYALLPVMKRMSNESQGTSIKGVAVDEIKKVQIIVPSSKAEQTAIANALSDVDTLIANLEKLIDKKKNIKQGAMQQLLTGKKRLPGFGSDERTGSRPTDERRKECHSERSAKREVEESSGYKMTELGMIPTDWEVKTLNELCECNRSSTLSLPKEFVYVDLESVCQGKLLKRQIVKACDAPSRAQRFFEKDDILYQTVRPYQKNNLKVDFDAKNYIASTGYAVLHSKESLLNCDYLYQYIHTDRFVDVVMDNCSGTSYPAINPKTLMTFEIIVPSSIEEQTAIANVLSDMDTEISALETKLAKYRTLKTGMMQQLLTGKIRLV